MRFAVRGRLLVVGLMLAIAACASSRRSEPLVGPFVPGSPEVARGEALFMRHCHACHPGGDAGLGPALTNKPLPGFLIKTQVRLGLGAMPAFSEAELPAADLAAVVTYLAARRAP
jgi:mono/diheme cytochrome c family protein